MNHCLVKIIILTGILGMLSCSTGNTGSSLKFTHGRTVPDEYIRVTDSGPAEIEFLIRAKTSMSRLYHLILDEAENRLAEGWFPTNKINNNSYTVRLKAKKGITFQPGVRYRLCVGSENPDYTSRLHTAYQCGIDYEFILPEK